MTRLKRNVMKRVTTEKTWPMYRQKMIVLRISCYKIKKSESARHTIGSQHHAPNIQLPNSHSITNHNELTPTTEWVPLAQVESQAILSSTLLNHQTRSSVIQDLPKQNDKTFTFDLDSFRYRMGCTANEAIDGSIFDTITKAIQCFEPTMEKTVATGSSSGQNLSRSRMSWRSTNENLYICTLVKIRSDTPLNKGIQIFFKKATKVCKNIPRHILNSITRPSIHHRCIIIMQLCPHLFH